jgi:Uncharacterized conserved protein (COG2071)
MMFARPIVRLPRVHGTIKRRLLINYRVDPAVMQRQLPAPFRPKLHAGYAIAGMCLIRLEDIRPRGVPRAMGLASENAAHRIAVEWEDETGSREGVYIPRRDTGSLVNHLAGGRLFPGEHHRALFSAIEDDRRIALHMRSADGRFGIDVVGQLAPQIDARSGFSSVGEASAFFERGSVGYSATASGRRLDGVVLKTESWCLEPLAVEQAYSTYFDDSSMFPVGSIRFDCGLIMRNIQHQWEPTNEIYL